MKKRNFGFTFGRTKEGDERDFADLERRLAEQAKRETPATDPIVVPNVTQPTIVNPTPTNLAFWTVPDVNYRGAIGRVEVLSQLLDNGSSKPQDDWAVYSEQERGKGNFYTPDFPLFYATLERAFDLKDEKAFKKQAEEMKTTLRTLSRANWLVTLTRLKYSPKGKDKIVHNFGLKDSYELQESFMGTDGKLPAGSPVSAYQSLLGTQNSLDKIKDVFKWLNGTPTYVWRLNQKPTNVTETVAGFYADSRWAGLNCDRNPTYTIASLGVRFVVEKK